MSINSIRADALVESRISKRLLLSDVGNTGADGRSVITLGDGVFKQAPFPSTDPFVDPDPDPQILNPQLIQMSGPFDLDSRYVPRIPTNWTTWYHLVFSDTSFVSVYLGPSPVTPAFLIGRIEKQQTDMNVDGSDVAVSWDLDGGDAQRHRTIQNNFFGVKIVVDSMRLDGRPVSNVQFKWALLGEMRFVGTTGVDTEHFPHPLTD